MVDKAPEGINTSKPDLIRRWRGVDLALTYGECCPGSCQPDLRPCSSPFGVLKAACMVMANTGAVHDALPTDYAVTGFQLLLRPLPLLTLGFLRSQARLSEVLLGLARKCRQADQHGIRILGLVQVHRLEFLHGWLSLDSDYLEEFRLGHVLLRESQEERDVLHQLERHLAVVDLRNGTGLKRVSQPKVDDACLIL